MSTTGTLKDLKDHVQQACLCTGYRKRNSPLCNKCASKRVDFLAGQVAVIVELMKIADSGEYEDLRRELESYMQRHSIHIQYDATQHKTENKD